MDRPDTPILFFLVTMIVFWLSAIAGAYLRRRRGALDDVDEKDLSLVLSASLTLFALIIGFSFSMAVGRYDLRKTYEEAEANAIGTEYVRAGLLPAGDAASVRNLLRAYLNQRILFYTTNNRGELAHINATTSELQNELWSVVQSAALVKPTPITSLAVAGMNDVLNSQGYTQAAWWNRIPVSAWLLMIAIGICSNMLFGYSAQRKTIRAQHFFMLPLIASVAFLLIADLDSPRTGLIRIAPQNLGATADSFGPATPRR